MKDKSKSRKGFLQTNEKFKFFLRNNIHNCNFKPIFHDIEEMAYIQKYSSLFGKS